MLGSGQLGRMFALAARRMGYRIHVYSPEAHSPAAQVADEAVVAPYDDHAALGAFAEGVAAVTVEFENIPAAALQLVAERRPMRPGPLALHTAQHRLREKDFLVGAGFPVAPYRRVSVPADLPAALAAVPLPALLKSAAFGYDGKGQYPVTNDQEATAALTAISGEAILEARVDLACEFSVIGARGSDGAQALYAPIRNTHQAGILDLSVAPSGLGPTVDRQARQITGAALEALEVVGVLCVEFFLTTDGRLMVNEVAPRPHNSGHLTIEAGATSQFEQQVRALCGLPLGATDLLCPAAMVNLLGDLWRWGEPRWPAALAVPGVNLHLYGKTQPRPGRKVGHLTALAANPTEAERRVVSARSATRVRGDPEL